MNELAQGAHLQILAEAGGLRYFLRRGEQIELVRAVQPLNER